MQFAKFLIAVFASLALGAALPSTPSQEVVKREPKVETQGASGNDDDDAIAYAWYAEDE
ncbi:hypothetical protein F5Y12DRAFT_738611 [Xylaria sp. FL1777]|nr:hypothetical protein F5Y12DRAFT_738611 [Xylaria sp. FL1777]